MLNDEFRYLYVAAEWSNLLNLNNAVV